jgi:hypothetical protein
MKKAAIATALVVCGCASSADEVAPVYISSNEYADFTCDQLNEEYNMVRSQVAHMSDAQDDQASQDAFVTATGVVLFWPALFFVEGDGRETEQLAQAKGREERLRAMLRERNCDDV